MLSMAHSREIGLAVGGGKVALSRPSPTTLRRELKAAETDSCPCESPGLQRGAIMALQHVGLGFAAGSTSSTVRAPMPPPDTVSTTRPATQAERLTAALATLNDAQRA